MKSTSLKGLALPSEATQRVSANKAKLNLSPRYNSLPTHLVAKWVTINWVIAGMIIPSVLVGLNLLTIILSTITLSSSAFLTLTLNAIAPATKRGLKEHMASLSSDISSNEWKYSDDNRGFRMYEKSRKNAMLMLLMPQRIFRKVLMNETVWYSPLRDAYTLQRSYFTAGNWVEETEEIAGRRYVYQKALKQL